MEWWFKKAVLLLAFVLFPFVDAATIYATVQSFSANGTQAVLQTVKVDPVSGAVTFILPEIRYVGGGAMKNGISAFDQQKNHLYYAPDIGSDYVYAVDVVQPSLLPILTVNALDSIGIDHDDVNGQLLFIGLYANGTIALFAIPDDSTKSSTLLLNLKTYSVASVGGTALDSSNSLYVSFVSGNANQYQIGKVSYGSSPATWTTSPFACSNSGTIAPVFLFYVASISGFRGLGVDSSSGSFVFFETAPKCTTVKLAGLSTSNAVTSASYDPTANIIYFGYQTGTGVGLGIFDAVKQSVNLVSTKYLLTNVQVSYK